MGVDKDEDKDKDDDDKKKKYYLECIAKPAHDRMLRFWTWRKNW